MGVVFIIEFIHIKNKQTKQTKIIFHLFFFFTSNYIILIWNIFRIHFYNVLLQDSLLVEKKFKKNPKFFKNLSISNTHKFCQCLCFHSFFVLLFSIVGFRDQLDQNLSH